MGRTMVVAPHYYAQMWQRDASPAQICKPLCWKDMYYLHLPFCRGALTIGFLLNPVLQDGDPVACSYKVEQFTALWGLYALGVFDGVIYSKISWEATSWRAVANCLSWHYTTYNTNLRQYSLFSLEGENLWNGTALSTLLEDFAWWNCLSGVRKVKMCCFEKLPAQLALTQDEMCVQAFAFECGSPRSLHSSHHDNLGASSNTS